MTLDRDGGAVPGAFATSWRAAVQPASRPLDRMRSFARRSMLSALAAVRRGSADRFVRCLYCHYVFDDQRTDFERIIVRLKDMGTFVGTDQLLAMLAGERPVDGRYFHLSFDDGFRNNFTNALLDVTHYRSVIETLRWDDLKAMLDAGYEVGSHTRTHARFSAMSADHARLEDEILGSKQDLETALGYRCRYISWPYGRTTDADTSSVGFTKAAGYDACFGAFRGSVIAGETDRYRIPRHHFEPQWRPDHVEYFARGNMEAAG
jgi:hypothetical protein